jgi:uncharacterized protein YggU (UPF0235/DUF167 family)
VSVWRHDGGDLLLSVRLSPGASRDAIGGVWADEKNQHWLVARVRAIPQKGRANGALIAAIARLLDMPKATISLESGDTNRLKRLRIRGGGDALACARLTAIIERQAEAT